MPPPSPRTDSDTLVQVGLSGLISPKCGNFFKIFAYGANFPKNLHKKLISDNKNVPLGSIYERCSIMCGFGNCFGNCGFSETKTFFNGWVSKSEERRENGRTMAQKNETTERT